MFRRNCQYIQGNTKYTAYKLLIYLTINVRQTTIAERDTKKAGPLGTALTIRGSEPKPLGTVREKVDATVACLAFRNTAKKP